ncbi:MAG: SMC family ATPase, partial [Turicibacter sp.]|nr:SMC family ATPase [Turicibacter sp.]
KEVNDQFIKEIELHFQTIEQYEVIKELMPSLSKLEQQVKFYYQELHTANKLLDMLTVELDGKERVDTVTLEHTMTEYERQKSELIKERAVILANIEQNEMILKSVDKKYQTIEMKEKEYAVVGELDSLANGRSGGKMSFETFVLSSYFDEVLEAANERLQKMTARRYYLLRREEVKGAGRKGLDLDVYDSHTCKTRPVNTLSGGESFKASLALALGLSDTVQQNSGGIQLDTMFIDEGFGTLDSESLDQAIDILMELQDYGRLIGVISHVNELKERIPAKLVVETNGMGSYAYFKK